MKTFYNLLALVASLVVMSADAAHKTNPNNFRKNTLAGQRDNQRTTNLKYNAALEEYNSKGFFGRLTSSKPTPPTPETITTSTKTEATAKEDNRGLIRKIGAHFARHPYIYGTLGLATVGLLGYNIYKAETTADHNKVVNGLINAGNMVKNAVVSTVKSPVTAWNWIRGNNKKVEAPVIEAPKPNVGILSSIMKNKEEAGITGETI